LFVVIVVYTVTEPALLALKKPKNRSEALTMWRGLLHNYVFDGERPSRPQSPGVSPGDKKATARDARSLRAGRPLSISASARATQSAAQRRHR